MRCIIGLLHCFAYLKKNVNLILADVSVQRVGVAPMQMLQNESNVVAPEFCDICFSTMTLSHSNASCSSTDSLVSDSNINNSCEIAASSPLALQSCQHWFCERCWQQHLMTLINKRSPQLKCPVKLSHPILNGYFD